VLVIRHSPSQADQQLGPEALFELFDDRRQARLADLEKHARGGGKGSRTARRLKVSADGPACPLCMYHRSQNSAA